MKALPMLSGCLFLALSAASLAQIDIYQSDAYSVEEMCARQAEQSDNTDYSNAYENCLQKNQNNPMYQAGAGSVEATPQGRDTPKDKEMKSES